MAASVDGADTDILLSNSSSPFYELHIDIQEQRLFYINQTGICYMDLKSGQHYVVYKKDPQTEDFLWAGVTVYKEHVYFIDNFDNTIRKCPINGCHKSEIIRYSMSKWGTHNMMKSGGNILMTLDLIFFFFSSFFV